MLYILTNFMYLSLPTFMYIEYIIYSIFFIFLMRPLERSSLEKSHFFPHPKETQKKPREFIAAISEATI